MVDEHDDRALEAHVIEDGLGHNDRATGWTGLVAEQVKDVLIGFFHSHRKITVFITHLSNERQEKRAIRTNR